MVVIVGAWLGFFVEGDHCVVEKEEQSIEDETTSSRHFTDTQVNCNARDILQRQYNRQFSYSQSHRQRVEELECQGRR
jgi:hypothetical protein